MLELPILAFFGVPTSARAAIIARCQGLRKILWQLGPWPNSASENGLN